MCKRLSKEHKAVILDAIEEKMKQLEQHIDEILDGEEKPCQATKTGKIVTKKK